MNICYAFVFIFTAVCFTLIGRTVPYGLLSLLCFWCVVSALWMTVAYLFQQPFLVLGKSPKRPFFALILMLNFPFLVAYWLLWIFRHGFSKNAPVNRIKDTNISISQWPIFRVSPEKYDVVIDLTSEMPAIYPVSGQYFSLPNLDGVPLCRWDVPSDLENRQILVHCAQGRGRSAVYAAMLLKELGYTSNADIAYEWLQQSRPSVHLTKAQLKQLRYYFQLTKN